MFKKIAVAAIMAVGFVASAQARMEGYQCFTPGNTAVYTCNDAPSSLRNVTVPQLYSAGWHVVGMTGGVVVVGETTSIRTYIIIEKDTSAPAAPAQSASTP